MPYTLFPDAETRTFEFTVQRPGTRQLQNLTEWRDLGPEVVVFRLATGRWGPIPELAQTMRQAGADYRCPYGVAIPCREHDDGYGSVLLLYCHSEDCDEVVEHLGSLQDQSREQGRDQIAMQMRPLRDA